MAALAVLFAMLPATASADRQYSLRYGATERGDITMASNTIVSCPDGAANCASARDGTGTVVRNSAWVMVPIDVDSDPSTFDSSSADLRVPAGATVLYAGLYWGSDTLHMPEGVDAPNPSLRGQVRLAAPDGSGYRTITASTVDSDRYYPSRYQGFADVTALVRSAGSGTYTVANVQASTGKDQYGGWGLVVAYRDASKPVRWLGLYDGFREFSGGDPEDVPIAGFRTPASGTVRADFGMLTYEGDIGVAPDRARLNGVDLSDELHAPDNYWNARITEYGRHVTTKNPNYVNQLGMDANVIHADGRLPNDATSAFVHMEVSTDLVMPGAMTLVSDQAAAAPSASAAPAVSGTARDGQVLSASSGTWSGTAPIAYSYEWLRCDAGGGSCSEIPGATGTTHTASAGDVGSTLRVRVTASNVVGPVASTSGASAVVAARPPVNTALPVVSGTARDGSSLSASDGGWTGTSIAHSYRWLRCDALGAGCAAIAGATGSSYPLVPADVGSTVRVEVRGANSGGSAVALSAPSGVVAAAPPAATGAPVVSGTARDGSTLSATDGSWSGTPAVVLVREWLRCDAAGDGCVVVGTAALSYALSPADVGSTVRVRVTGTNAAGSASVTSDPTAVVAAAAPVSTGAPAVSGTARDGQTLGSTPGGWSGTPTIELARQWLRCDAAGEGCVPVAGATGSGHVLGAADVGHTIRLLVSASNAGGTAEARSAPTAVVGAEPPAAAAGPSVEGTARDGQVLSARQGTWTGTAPVGLAHRWLRCNAGGGACAAIGGATASTYELVPADVGRTLRVEVTGSNGGGSAVAISDQTAVVEAGPPVNETPPSIGGTVRDGETLSADDGAWSGTPTIVYTRQWRRCEPGGLDCANVPGATGTEYTLTVADVGRTIRVRVNATNGGGERGVDSAATATVAAIPPAGLERPLVAGTAREGETLTLGDGAWAGSAPLAYAYRWERCDAGETTCAPIAGATNPAYTLAAADANARVRGVVTATNAGGAATAHSDATAPVEPKPANPPGTDPGGPNPPGTDPGGVDPADPPGGGANPPADGDDPTPPNPPGTDPGGVDPPGTDPGGSNPPGTDPGGVALAAVQWKSSTGTGLRLRLQSGAPVARVGFSVPSALLPKRGDAHRVVGRVSVYGADGRARTWKLRYPRAGALLLSGPRVPRVELAKAVVRVTGVPAGTRLLKLTLYTRDSTSPGALVAKGRAVELSASVRTAGGALVRAKHRLEGGAGG